MTYERFTLAAPAVFAGRGLHTGAPVQVTVLPYDKGIAFRYGLETVRAHPDEVTDTTRSTKLGQVGTVEHLMSALAGLEITDALVEVTAPELPGLDGSAREFVAGLHMAGRVSLGTAEAKIPFKRVFHVTDEVKVAVAAGTGHWRYRFEVGSRWPGEQTFETEQVARDYATEVAPARTFALAEEVPGIIQAGLGQGLDESSALILGIEGYKNDPRFDDEPARHKLLDLVGDLYLTGIPIRLLNVSAERSGHRANVEAARLVVRFAEAEAHLVEAGRAD